MAFGYYKTNCRHPCIRRRVIFTDTLLIVSTQNKNKIPPKHLSSKGGFAITTALAKTINETDKTHTCLLVIQ